MLEPQANTETLWQPDGLTILRMTEDWKQPKIQFSDEITRF